MFSGFLLFRSRGSVRPVALFRPVFLKSNHPVLEDENYPILNHVVFK
jgi:hypothetical protein